MAWLLSHGVPHDAMLNALEGKGCTSNYLYIVLLV